MRGEYDHDKIQAALEELKTQVAEDASGVWGVTKFYELEQYNLSFVFRRDLNEDFWAWVDELEDEKKTAVEEFLAANGPDKEYKGPINEDDIGYGH